MALVTDSPFLSIRAGDVDGVTLPALAVVTGANGSGKTHLLQALFTHHIRLDELADIGSPPPSPPGPPIAHGRNENRVRLLTANDLATIIGEPPPSRPGPDAWALPEALEQARTQTLRMRNQVGLRREAFEPEREIRHAWVEKQLLTEQGVAHMLAEAGADAQSISVEDMTRFAPVEHRVIDPFSASLEALFSAYRTRRNDNRAAISFYRDWQTTPVGLFEAMTKIGPLRDRFLSGDQAFNYNGLNLNTSGREKLWSATRQAIPEHWWIGHGPGQCQLFIKERFVTIEHPHNEYLRLLYDTGVIGLALWSLGLLSLIVAAWRRYRVADRNEDRAVHIAAILGVLVLLLGAITDNLSVTLPTALAIGTLVGMSMGRANVPRTVAADVDEPAEPSLADR